jgi:lipopolysaccharide/colanic/teichoic acid biosynthesis glycosyltransferase
VLLPVFLVIASLIKLTSKGPIFYKQIRTGYLGKTFTLIKFRSMFTDSEINGPQWCTDNDCRITPLGKFLRKTRLDEFPQLLNVLKGEMSFFGPRPERPEIYNELKKEIPLFSLRTIVRPGITGWAQVCAGYAASVQESRLKLEYDLYYIQHMSPRLDLIILVKTLEVALFGSKRLPVPKVVDVSVSAPAVASN